MAGPAKKKANEPEPRPIIVKKIIVEGHGGHHGGAWKVAYADFVTAMMAFFLLMWLLGATTEKQRKGLADYFTPTLIQTKEASAGSTGLFGGDSMMAKENYPTTGGQGTLAITIPRDATGTADKGGKDQKDSDRQRFEALKHSVLAKMEKDAIMRRLKKNIRFTETREGLRIDLIDEADFAMFGSGNDTLMPEARKLIGQVGQLIVGLPNEVIVRGHTDGAQFGAGRGMNNWLLSSARAEATRVELARNGVGGRRFARIEGVADREPFNANPYDPRNRRMSVVLAWSTGAESALGVETRRDDAPNVTDPAIREAIAKRDDPRNVMRENARRADMGGTMLPTGATVVNADSIPKRTGVTPPGKTDATFHE
ncbi:MAG TPA: flagellar motor protein MotB [Sphingobium sp.]